MRNIRDYKSKLREAKDTLGSASPFNIITKSLTINTFTPAEIESLYRQHTDAKRIIEPIILGKKSSIRLSDNDTQYCLNLGLIRNENGIFKPFNPIYSEVIIRTLNYDTQHDLINFVKNAWFTSNGDIDMNGLLKEFQNFWRLHSGMWLEKYDYKEAAPHLVLNAFLQRVINGGGRVEREYAYGRDRMDLCVIYNQKKYPIELKILYDKNTIQEGIIQLSEYMDGLDEKIGWLVVFDRNPNKKWKDKIYWKTEERNSLTIHILGA